jgi:hypothetical protein
MDSTHSQTMPRHLKINISIPFTSLFYKTYNFSQKSCSPQIKMFPKIPKTHLYIKQKKLKKTKQKNS